MKKKAVFFVALTFLCALLPVFGQRPTRPREIKLASMVPENSDWGQIVNKLAAEWTRVTNGEVKLVVYANGTQGNEEEVLRKLNMNTIQAGIFTSIGLNLIAPEIMALSVPFMIRSDAELDEVLRQVKGDFEARINAKNYFALALVKGGWVKLFSRNPIYVPADLKRQKFAHAPYEAEMARAFRQMGYQMVQVDPNRLLIALNGGTADAIFQSPIFTAGAQYFGVAKNMSSINIAPFIGGIVMNKQAWESIPAQYRTELMRVTRRIGAELESSLLRLETETIRLMKNNGLRENQINPTQLQEWYSDAEKAVPSLMGSTFDRTMYNKIAGILNTYRSRR
jgi:TRAP-type C4-dicarboxylate transport system substrate-binding protein